MAPLADQPRASVLLYMVVTYLLTLGLLGVLGAINRSAWGTNLLALLIAIGLMARRPFWRICAIGYMGVHMLLLVTYSGLLLFSQQPLLVVGVTPQSGDASAHMIIALAIIWGLSTHTACILVLASPEVRKLFAMTQTATPRMGA